MNILSRIRAQFKSSAIEKHLAIFTAGRPIWTPRNYAAFAEEGYQKNAVVYTCIRKIANSMSGIAPLVYAENGEREITTGPIIDLIRRPNPSQSWPQFIEALTGYYYISGNAYIEAVIPSRSGAFPLELYVHRPDRIKIIPSSSGVPAAYEYTVNAIKTSWQVDPVTGASPILHIRAFNPLNDWYGMSPIEAAAYSADILLEANKWNKSLLENGARPSGALTVDGTMPLTPAQRASLRSEITEVYSGSKNAGRPILLDGGLKWQDMGLSPKELEFIQSKYVSAREIAHCFGVPSMLLGIPGDNTYSNYQEARLSLWEDTVIPFASLVFAEMSRWLSGYADAPFVLAYDDDAIPALAARRVNTWDKLKGIDFLTDNEKRESLGYEPIDGGDVVYKPLSVIPSEQLSETSADSAPKLSMPAETKAVSLLNLSGAKARARTWREWVRVSMAHERSFAGKVNALLSRIADDAASRYTIGGMAPSIDGFKDDISTLLRAQYSAVSESFSRMVFDSMPKGFKARDDIYARLMDDWMSEHLAAKVTAINATTRALIIDAIDDGLSEEESVKQIADRIRLKVGGDMGWARARTISTTETHAAATAASDLAAESTGLALTRRWLSAQDDAVRDSHRAADGQLARMDEAFSVGGVSIMRPGDPDAPPGETVNCRCIVDYISVR